MRSTTSRLALTGFLVVGLALGCGTDSDDPTLAQPSESPTPSATATPTPSTAATPSSDELQPIDSSQIPTNRRDFGFVEAVERRGGTDYLVFDRAIMYVGDEANEVAAERGEPDVPVANDYIIVNDNPQLRLIPVDPDVTVRESIQMVYALGHRWGTMDDDRTGPFSDLVEYVERYPELPGMAPFHLSYGEDDTVTRIEEQYLP